MGPVSAKFSQKGPVVTSFSHSGNACTSASRFPSGLHADADLLMVFCINALSGDLEEIG